MKKDKTLKNYRKKCEKKRFTFPLLNFNLRMLLPCQQGGTGGLTALLRGGHCCEEPHSTSQYLSVRCISFLSRTTSSGADSALKLAHTVTA